MSSSPDWRRLEVAARRYGELIATGISTAMERHCPINEGTARCIAHVLGRSLRPESALAAFGSTGGGDYTDLREEYLALHHNAAITESTQELIDWLGTYLIRQDHPDARTITYREVSPPRLDNLLVPTGIEVGDWYLTVHVPGIYGAHDIAQLTERLGELAVDQDASLRAFLGLPDVNAMSGNIMADFHEQYIGVFRDVEEALHELAEVDESERDVVEYAAERHLIIEQVSVDYEALRKHAENSYDFVEEEGRIFVFSK